MVRAKKAIEDGQKKSISTNYSNVVKNALNNFGGANLDSFIKSNTKVIEKP
jgi:hypothetical protein